MTIEIRQLVIRAVVEAPPADAAPSSPARWPDDAPRPAAPLDDAQRQALLADCVREVMRRLARERER